MIDIKDLRLGNLVYGVSDRIEEVIVLAEGVVTTTLVKLRDATFTCEYDGISGIELTEEWLYNFGAKKIGWYSNYSAIAFEYGTWFLEWNKPDKKMSICNYEDVIFEVDCEYVHQLQNLVYSLTKNELRYENNGK